jgi:hypothetical protein
MIYVKRVWMSAALVLLAAAGSLSAGETGGDKTDGMINGKFWNELTSAQRVTYVAGMFTGLHTAELADIESVGKTIEKEFFALGSTPDTSIDFVREMNAVYEDPGNINIPIAFVYSYCNSKLEGSSTERQLQDRLNLMRKLFAPEAPAKSRRSSDPDAPPPSPPVVRASLEVR